MPVNTDQCRLMWLSMGQRPARDKGTSCRKKLACKYFVLLKKQHLNLVEDVFLKS